MSNSELPSSVEPRDEAYYSQLADELELMNSSVNSGRGYSHLATMIGFLRAGDVAAAKAVAYNESDKWDNPDIKEIQHTVVHKLFEDDEDHPWRLFWKDDPSK